MFERYTESARRVIFFGRYEAAMYGSPSIETDHLLLAMYRDGKTFLAKVAPGLREDAIREPLEKNKGPNIDLRADFPLSNESKRVLAYGAEEAGRLRDHHIGVEHLFLGLLREPEGGAAKALAAAGVKLDDIRRAVKAAQRPKQSDKVSLLDSLYCPNCAREVTDPLTCGDCSAVICRVCGTPLEAASDLGMG